MFIVVKYGTPIHISYTLCLIDKVPNSKISKEPVIICKTSLIMNKYDELNSGIAQCSVENRDENKERNINIKVRKKLSVLNNLN